MRRDRSCALSGRGGYRRRVGQWLPRKSTRVTLRGIDTDYVLWYSPRRGYRLAETVSRAGGRRLVTIHPHEWAVKMKKRQIGQAAKESSAQHLAGIESKHFGGLHSLVAHCAVTRYDDGDVRQPGSMIIKTQGAAWVIVLKDPDAAAQLQVIGQTLDEALELAAMLLDSDEAPWEEDRWAKSRQPRKKAG